MWGYEIESIDRGFDEGKSDPSRSENEDLSTMQTTLY